MKKLLTLLEASIMYDIDEETLALALGALARRRGGAAICAARKRDGKFYACYEAADVEEAVALEAARQLGFDG